MLKRDGALPSWARWLWRELTLHASNLRRNPLDPNDADLPNRTSAYRSGILRKDGSVYWSTKSPYQRSSSRENDSGDRHGSRLRPAPTLCPLTHGEKDGFSAASLSGPAAGHTASASWPRTQATCPAPPKVAATSTRKFRHARSESGRGAPSSRPAARLLPRRSSRPDNPAIPL